MSGDAVGAESAYTEALRLCPEHVVTLCNLGGLLSAQDRLGEGATMLRRAVELAPDFAEARANLGGVLVKLSEPTEAVDQCLKATSLSPDHATGHANLAAAWREVGDIDAAMGAAERAVALDPKLIEAQITLAALLLDKGQADASEAVCARALAIDSNFSKIHYNIGNIHLFRGDESAAAISFERATTLDPGDADAQLASGRLGLRRRDLAGFWSVYRHRWQSPNYQSFRRAFPYARWRGEELEGKSILVWGEQGIGDEIFFAGLYPEVIARAAHCVIEAEQRLVPLFARSFPAAEVVERTEPPASATSTNDIDLQAPAGDLGEWLRPTFVGFEALGNYLVADQTQVDRLIERYSGNRRRPIIGISWASRESKEIPLVNWGPILRGLDAEIVSLQYGDRREEIGAAEKALEITVYDDPAIDPLVDMDGFAAQVAAVDLVITIDNSTLAVAAALGRPTMAMLPRQADWRYDGLDEGCPWHECLRIFRQQPQSEWSPVIDETAGAAQKFVADFVNDVNFK